MRWEVNISTEGILETPQAWAAHNGHDEVVKMLLAEGKIGPGHPHDSGRVPLWYAA